MHQRKAWRKWALGISALAVTALTVGCASPGDDGNGDGAELIIASWGGAFSEATSNSLGEPFGAEEGVEVTIVDASSQHVAQVEAQAGAGNISWDIVDSLGEANSNYLWSEGLLEPLPEDLRTRLEEVSLPGAVTEFGILQSTIATIIACNPDEAEACPTTPAELFDTENFPGPRMMYNDPYYLIMTAMLADGKTPDTLWPLTDADIDRAFEMLEEIAPHVRVWWTSGDQSQQAIQNGEVVMGMIWNGPAGRLAEANPQVTFSWEYATLNTAWTSVVKGAPNRDAAFAYLEWYATHPEAQAEWAVATGYGVASPEASDYLTDQQAVFSVMNPENTGSLALGNGPWWVENREVLTERWQGIVTG